MYIRIQGEETGLSRKKRFSELDRRREERLGRVYTKYNKRRKCFNLLHRPFRSAAQHWTLFPVAFGSGARRERNTDIFRPTGFVIPDKLGCPGKIGRSRIRKNTKKKYKANHCNSSHYDDCFLLFCFGCFFDRVFSPVLHFVIVFRLVPGICVFYSPSIIAYLSDRIAEYKQQSVSTGEFPGHDGRGGNG